MKRIAFLLALALASAVAAAQEYKPYPRAHITTEQWQQYYGEVSSKHAASRQDIPEQSLVVFEDKATYTSYAFTLPGHPAHPAWVTRQVVQDSVGVNVKQIGYYAGDEAPFAQMFRQYQQLNDRMRDDFKKRSQQGKQ